MPIEDFFMPSQAEDNKHLGMSIRRSIHLRDQTACALCITDSNGVNVSEDVPFIEVGERSREIKSILTKRGYIVDDSINYIQLQFDVRNQNPRNQG